MTPFQVLLSTEMLWLCAIALVALLLYWQRGRIQQSAEVATVKDVITVEALSGNVRKTILQYRAIGYEPTSVVSRGSLQRITLFKNVKIPTDGARRLW